MSIQFIAKQYIDLGWAVVPLNPGEKRASVRWQNTTYKPSDFNDDSNIAVKLGTPSAGLVDVDCDHPFAVAAAKALLPQTGKVFGRTAKPSSHYLFLCPGIRTTQFTDVKKADGTTQTLVEIRSTGGYTMFPPSLHPSGDAVAWELDRDPMQRSPEEMYADVRAVALATMIAIHYPSTGGRHHTVGQYLPGFLLQGGIDEIMVRQIIKTAADIAGDTDWADRDKAIRATIDKHKRGENVTGGPKLAAEIGAEVVTKMRAWLKLADVDALESMNARHFFVRLGSKSVIGREDDPAGVIFQPVKELYPEYANCIVQTGSDAKGNAQFAPLFETWLKSPNRRSYSRVTFAPPPLLAYDHEYNLWTGFAVEDAPGSCDRYLAHLRDVICAGNLEHYEYLLDWMAYCVQFPGKPAEVAVVMRGGKGAGKGTVVQMFERIFGKRNYAHLSRSEELVKWNSLVSGKVVVFADEAFFAGDKENTGALKRIITEPTITVSRKHLDSTEEPNCIHLFMATNEDWAIPAGIGERRFFALRVRDEQAQDPNYFTPLYDEMNNGGVEAFLHLLRARPVTVARIRAVPKTEELRVQQDQSLPLEMRWLQECLWEGTIGMIRWEETDIPVSRMYEAYKLWCRDRSARFLDTKPFAQRIYPLCASRFQNYSPRINGEKTKCVKLLSLDDARKAFDVKLHTTTDWPDDGSATGTPGIPF